MNKVILYYATREIMPSGSEKELRVLFNRKEDYLERKKYFEELV